MLLAQNAQGKAWGPIITKITECPKIFTFGAFLNNPGFASAPQADQLLLQFFAFKNLTNYRSKEILRIPKA